MRMILELRIGLVLIALALFPLSDAFAGLATLTGHPTIVGIGNVVILAIMAGSILWALAISREIEQARARHQDNTQEPTQATNGRIWY